MNIFIYINLLISLSFSLSANVGMFQQHSSASFFDTAKEASNNPDNWKLYRGHQNFLLYDPTGRVILNKEEYALAKKKSEEEKKTTRNDVLFYNGRHYLTSLYNNENYWLLFHRGYVSHTPTATNSNCFTVKCEGIEEAKEITDPPFINVSSITSEETFQVVGTPTEEDLLVQNTTVTQEESTTVPELCKIVTERSFSTPKTHAECAHLRTICALNLNAIKLSPEEFNEIKNSQVSSTNRFHPDMAHKDNVILYKGKYYFYIKQQNAGYYLLTSELIDFLHTPEPYNSNVFTGLYTGLTTTQEATSTETKLVVTVKKGKFSHEGPPTDVDIAQQKLSSLYEPFSKEPTSKNQASPYQLLSDVIGATEAKIELQTILHFLQNPEPYTRLGATPHRGILFTGPPGTGKTLLARTFAHEAGYAFFYKSGAEFVEQYVGTGAARIRELFEKARKSAPAIIFIDEIDSLAAKRQDNSDGGREWNTTLNELLVQMDGFNSNNPLKPVIVIAATNRVNTLDPAILRPGRFDKIITIGLPNEIERQKILEFYSQKSRIDSSIDFSIIAAKTDGYSGAQLAHLVNQAALLAVRDNSDSIQQRHFQQSYMVMEVGSPDSCSIKMDEKERLRTAFHEAGHTLMLVLLRNDINSVIDKVTIERKKDHLGRTFTKRRINTNDTAKTLFSEIQVGLGGDLAEEIEFNHQNTGSTNDLEMIANIASKMVCEYGMSPVLGKVNYTNTKFYSQKTAAMIDDEVRKIINDASEKTRVLLIEHRSQLRKLAYALMEKETLSAQEVYDLLNIQPNKAE